VLHVFAVFALLLASPIRAEIIDRVLAVVNGTILMQSDVYAAMAIGIVTAGGAADPVAPALEQLIERELVLAEVNRYAPPEPSEPEIAARVAGVRARFPSPEAYQRALVVSGLSEERVRTIQRDELRIQTYVNQRFGAASTDRAKAIADWTASLRRRADITMNLGRK
jgi:hypothetical protein